VALIKAAADKILSEARGVDPLFSGEIAPASRRAALMIRTSSTASST
jgi:hypothetical protein